MMMSCGRWVVAAGLTAVVAVPAWSGAPKPLGGICECGSYIEGPALCAPLAKAKRDVCISSNLTWLGKCTAWRDTMCHAPAAEPVKAAAAPVVMHPSIAEAPPAVSSPAPVVPAPVQPAPIVASPAVTKFGGIWTGQAQCRFDKWRLSLKVSQLANGSLLTDATTSQSFGSFDKIDLKDDGVVLHYDSGLHETVYTGHLVKPDRIEGTVHVAGNDCTWYLSR
jgi:hypothetical protein